MALRAPDFWPVRACLFDMDGLLIDTEDLYTLCINVILERYQRPRLPWSIKAKLQGRPGPEANRIFEEWAQLPVPHDEYVQELQALQRRHFPGAQPLPGVAKLLADLDRTRHWAQGGAPAAAGGEDDASAAAAPQASRRVHIALATSTHRENFGLKTSHLADLFSFFPPSRQVLGDDARIRPGRGKPLPDIYLLALQTINDSLPAGEPPVEPAECLVFEDSVSGVEAGRRAGMRVIWCPHPMLKKEYAGREGQVLAGTTGEAGEADLHQVGEVGDGWGEYLPTLVDFPYQRYGIVIPPS